MNAIFKRVSVRRFQNLPVEPEKIHKILQAAMNAPSGGNQKPWEFYVVTSQDKLEQLSKTSRYSVFTKNAPVTIVPCFRTEHLIYPELTALDMSLACENILLETTELGLGGVFLAVYPYEDRIQHVGKVLALPENLRAFSLIPIGYPVQQRTRTNTFDASRIHNI